MKIKSLIAAGALSAITFALPSCNSSSSEDYSPVYTDIVTVSQFTDNSSVFTFRRVDDSPLVTLTSTRGLNPETVKIGDRMLMSYQTNGVAQFENAAINIVGIVPTYGKGATFPKAKAEETNNFYTAEVFDASAWRSGTYLNLAVLYGSASAPKDCRIVVDETTLSNPYPQLYFILEPQPAAGAGPERIYYLSHTLTELFSRSTCKGVTLNYTLQSGKKQFTVENINSIDKPKPIE